MFAVGISAAFTLALPCRPVTRRAKLFSIQLTQMKLITMPLKDECTLVERTSRETAKGRLASLLCYEIFIVETGIRCAVSHDRRVRLIDFVSR